MSQGWFNKKLLQMGTVRIMIKEYTTLGGWSVVCDEFVTKEQATKIAANFQRGNANMAETPEEWAAEKIGRAEDFKCFRTPEVCYKFSFHTP